MYTLPQLVKKIRNEAGLTQAEFAEEIGVSTVLIAMVESGQKEASKNLIRKIAERLDVHPSSITPFLFAEETDKRTGLSPTEKQLLRLGTKLQEHLIKNKTQSLKRGSNEARKIP